MRSASPMQILEYWEFYDIPRFFIIEPQLKMFLYFGCSFDEERDDYGDFFTVAVLRTAEKESWPKPWRQLEILASIGRVAVSAVIFDDTKRKDVIVEGLSDLVAMAEQAMLKDVKKPA